MYDFKLFVIVFLLLANNGIIYSQSNLYFSRAEVIQDLEYLKTSLEKAHYNLYAFIPPERFNANFNEVKSSITQDSITLKATVGYFQRVISKANTGHAEIDFPIQSYIAYANQGGTLFPLEIAIEDNKTLIRKNFSENENIETGSELLSINGTSINKILEDIYPHLSAEREYFKNAKLEFWSFPRLHWQVSGEHNLYEVEINSGGEIFRYEIKSVSLGNYESARNGEILYSSREFKTIGEVAYLNPGPFGSIPGSGENEYQSFIDSTFSKIRHNNIQTLIVDLRNNSGGHDSFSNYLVAYFADKPFKWYSEFSLKTSDLLKEQTRLHNDTTETYFKTILDKPSGTIYSYDFDEYQPVNEDHRFKGDVFVLVNRQTYSMAAVTAALIQDYNFGTIVGEETGDLPTLYASQFSFPLPNTGILVKIPKGYIVRPNGSEKLEGVVPSIKINDHLLDDEDEILNGLLEQL